MEIKLEIGENLGQTIETLIRNSGGDAGMQIQDAFKIDFMKLIKEHAEGEDVKLEVKDVKRKMNQEEKKVSDRYLITSTQLGIIRGSLPSPIKIPGIQTIVNLLNEIIRCQYLWQSENDIAKDVELIKKFDPSK